jgi:hypothetical protein
MAFLDVAAMRLLNEEERRQVTPRRSIHTRPDAQRKHRIKGIPAAPEAAPPACLPLEFILRKQVNIGS